MKILNKIEEGICILCLIAMTALVFANVFSRYVLHLSLSFSEEITTNLFVLLSMMGTAIAARRRAHLGLSILTDAVSPKLRRALLVFGFGLATVFSFAVFFYGIKMVRNEYILGQVTPSMQWPEWVYGCFVPFGAFFMTLRNRNAVSISSIIQYAGQSSERTISKTWRKQTRQRQQNRNL